MAERGPRQIGPYRITGALGRGGMGTVYEAWDDRLRRAVALKLIREDDADGRTRARFRREAQIAAGLSHPSIVQIFDILETDDGDAIVLERVAGENLSERMRRGPLEIPEVVLLARQIVEGLAEAHRHGIVHRDLKPENVMVTGGHDASLRLKILDFGLAKPFATDKGRLTQDGAVLGSYLAMSPEQAQGREVDHRSDLFSLGTLLYQMVTGRSPFAAENVPKILINICTLRQTPARELCPDAPAALSELIDRLLEKDPARRPQEAGAVLQALARLPIPEAPVEREPALGGVGEAEPGRPSVEPQRQPDFSDLPTLHDSGPGGLRARARETLLDRVERFWIHEVLEIAVPACGPLRLHERSVPEKVVRPWRRAGSDSNVGEVPRGSALEGSALEWFAHHGWAPLILGEPGSGKTFRLLELAREAIAAARDDPVAPLPVVLPLASWNPASGSLAQWIAQELKLRYHIPRSVADGWVREGSLLLLLDGLDEVATEHRTACAEAISGLRREAGLVQIAVTCRSSAYQGLEEAGSRLALYSAIELQPLAREQVDRQIEAAGQESAELDAAREQDPELEELLGNPLMLSVFLEGALGTPASQKIAGDLRQRALATYVRRLLDRPLPPGTRLSKDRIVAWLASMARGLLHSREAMFQIERLQPLWLPAGAARRSYLLLSRLLLASAVGGLIAAMAAVAPPEVPPLEIPAAAVLAGLALAGLDARRFRRPAPPDAPEARQRTGHSLAVALIALLANLAVQFFLGALQPGFLIFAVIFAWLLGWKGVATGYGDDVQPVAALAWSWRKARKGLAAGAAFGLVVGLGMALGRTRSLAPMAILLESLGPVAFLAAIGAVVAGLKETLAGGPLRPNFGTWISLRTALIGGGSLAAAVIVVALGLFGPLEPWLINAPVRPNFLMRPLDFEEGWTRALPLAFFIGSFGVLSYGILEVLKHYSLRLVLWRAGCLPLAVAPFLAAAAHLGLLRLGSGGAIFRHRLLLEYFAREPADPETSP